ncbi:sarcosine dehydrogenase, mitochondrial-like, partial [Cyanistes caeruleus]|uniref:sarcosine dehydrogenase, mitochondrial-like n=1 Tax=Cyanistes caeruleus TaxID=156563 RepID=UPI000CDB729E
MLRIPLGGLLSRVFYPGLSEPRVSGGQGWCFVQGSPGDLCLLPAGYRHWHADLRPDDTPLEAGLAFTCKLKSSIPFLGREAVETQKAKGIFRRLVCFTTEEKVPMFGLEAVWRDGKVVGHIRRADFGFAIDKTIAYGYIRDPAGGP